ncbi:MAG: NAD(P)-dependent oxidoreductase [Lachnospiraceae bacterium]|nr:NAD(P)-dependent oxidoreductase [Lachnospiraceae bacterium]
MILVTGCLGYIGNKIVRALLKEGYKVRGLVMKKQVKEADELKELGMEVFIGDLLYEDSLTGIGEDIDIVFHLAGIHSSVKNMEELYVNGTKTLFRVLECSPVRLIIFSSNASVYGSYIINNTVMTEEAEDLVIEHPFAEITKNAEEVIKREAGKNNVKYIILRIGEVYGYNKYNLIKKAQHPFSMLGNGENYVSLIHIDDLINVLMLCIDGLEEGVYNVCDSNPCVKKELFRYVAKLSNKYEPVWLDTNDIEERIMNSIHGLRMLSINMSNEKLCKRVGYKLLYKDYMEGLNSLLEYEGQEKV